MQQGKRQSRIMILGAGNAQIDLIHSCRERGLETFGCSYSDQDPGIALLDHFEKIDIRDTEALYSYAKQIHADYVYSIGSDMAMPPVSLLSERLGTPHFVSSQTAELCCNKSLMRGALKGTPYYIPYESLTQAEEFTGASFPFPVEVKPVDSQGQRGVAKASDMESFRDCFAKAKQFSKTGKVIVEPYLSGDEVSVNAFLQDGEIIFCMITDRESFEEFPGGIIKKHYIPAALSDEDLQSKIFMLVKEVVGLFSIKEGPVYFQIMICDGKPYLIEMTPRLDGCHMWRLIKLYCGTDLLEMTLDRLMGKTVEVKQGGLTRALITEFLCEPPGTVFARSHFQLKPALYTQYYYEDGEIVKSINGYMEKCGFQIYERPDQHAGGEISIR